MTEAEKLKLELELLELEADAARGRNAPAQVKDSPMSRGRAGVLGFGQGGTLGFADEIGGALGKLLLPEGVKLGPAAQPQPDDTPEVRALKQQVLAEESARPSNYELVRDSMRAEVEQAKKERPRAFLGGEIGGGLATAVLPGGAPKTLGQLLKTGAALGAASGLGSSNADLTKGEVGGAVFDTLEGGAGGVGGALVGHGVAKAAPVLFRALRSKLDDLAVSQGRRVLQGGSDIAAATRKPLSPDAVREALDQGAILPMGTTQGAAKRLERAVETHGNAYNSTLQALEEAGVPGARVADVTDAMLARGAQEELTTGANKAVPNLFMREATNLENLSLGQPNLPLGRAEAIKRSLQAQAQREYAKLPGTVSPLGDAKVEVASILRQANEDAVERAAQEARARLAPPASLKELAERVAADNRKWQELASQQPRPLALPRKGGGQVVVSPDASKPGRWRATRLDADGTPTGHMEAADFAGAVRAAKDSGATAFDAVEAAKNTIQLADEFVPLKQRMGRLLEANAAAQRGASKAAQRNAIGLPERIAMGTAIVTNPAAAVGAGMGTALLKSALNRGASTVSSGAHYGARLSKALASLAQQHPRQLAQGAFALTGAGERALLPELLSDEERDAIIQALRRK